MEGFKDRVDFNRQWWGSVQHGEIIAEDEITEVQWLIEELQRMYDKEAAACPVCGATHFMSATLQPEEPEGDDDEP